MPEFPAEFAASGHPIRSAMRKAQVADDLARLQARIEGWLQHCAGLDAHASRHESQLGLVRKVLLGVLEELKALTAGVDDALWSSGEVADRCRKLSEATVWLERIWEFLRTKIDQRFEHDETSEGDETPHAEGDPRSLAVQAADEVVWSCYRPISSQLKPGHPAYGRIAAPLSYIEPEYSPAAMQTDQPLPPGLRLVSGDPELDRRLQRLPMALLRLPPWCVGSPWSLVFVAHEVGHHVQNDLGLVLHVAEGLRGAALACGLAPAAARLWEAWSQEIFADAFSVLAMGPWAARAIAEVEWGPPASLLRRKIHYPAPAVRVGLMLRMSQRSGFGPIVTPGLPSFAEWQALAQTQPASAEDWAVIEAAVQFLRQPLPNGLPALHDLLKPDTGSFAAGGKVDVWAGALRGMGNLVPSTQREDARLMACAAMSAWSRITAEADETKRKAWHETLKARAARGICACAEPGKRPAVNLTLPADAVQRLTESLFDPGPPAGDESEPLSAVAPTGATTVAPVSQTAGATP